MQRTGGAPDRTGGVLYRTGVVLQRTGGALARTGGPKDRTGVALQRSGVVLQRTGGALERTCGAIERSRHVLPLEPAAAHTAGPPIPFTFKTLKTNVKNALGSYHFLTAGKVNRCKNWNVINNW